MKTICMIIAIFAAANLYAANNSTAAIQSIEPESPIADPFYHKIYNVLEILKQKKIVNGNGLSENDKSRMIEALLKSIRSDLRYIPAGDKDYVLECSKSSAQTSIYPPVLLRKGSILYLKIDCLSDDAVTNLVNNYEKALTTATPPEGVILDLRNCGSFETQNAGKIAATFFDSAAMAVQKKIVKSLPNCAVLFGEKTVGTPEIVAWLAGKAKNVITIGAPSAGMPFKPEIIKLQDGSSLLIPQIPDAYKNMPDGPVKPVIDSPGSKTTAAQGASAEDACVMQASDLLISMKMFNRGKR